MRILITAKTIAKPLQYNDDMRSNHDIVWNNWYYSLNWIRSIQVLLFQTRNTEMKSLNASVLIGLVPVLFFSRKYFRNASKSQKMTCLFSKISKFAKINSANFSKMGNSRKLVSRKISSANTNPAKLISRKLIPLR